MHRFVLLTAVAVAIALVSSNSAHCAEKAATDQLPAALQAVDAAPSQILTTEQAQEVRGEGFWFTIYGNVNTYSFQGYLHAQGDAIYLNVFVDPYTFSFVGY